MIVLYDDILIGMAVSKYLGLTKQTIVFKLTNQADCTLKLSKWREFSRDLVGHFE